MGMHKEFTNGAASAPNDDKRFTHGPAKPQQFLRKYIEQKQSGLIPSCDCSQKHFKDGYHSKDCSSIPPNRKKLTFDEWYRETLPLMPENKAELVFLAQQIWRAAQENK